MNFKKVGIGAILAGAGAGLAYLSQWLSGHDLGQFGPIAAAVLSVAVNFVRKLAQGENG